MNRNSIRRRAQFGSFSLLFALFACSMPAGAQLGQWLQHQILGSKGNSGNNNQPPQSGRNQPTVGYDPSYYRPVQDPVNPLTGMNRQMIVNSFSMPPDLRPYGSQSIPRSNPGKAQDLLAKGDQQIDQGLDIQAEQTLYQAYLYDRSNAYIYNDLGVVCDRLNHQQAALYYYKEAATLDPKFAQAYYNAGLDEYSYAGPIPGFPLLIQALRLDGSHANWWYRVGNDKVLTGQNSDGLYYYSQAIKLDSRYADAYHWRGVLEMRMGQDTAAHVDLQRARALNPSLRPSIAEFVNAITKARHEEKELEEAQAREAVAQRRAVQEAQSYYQTHRRSIQQAVSQGPRYYEAVYNQARQSGQSPEEASKREEQARSQYNKDVALQNAWENSDYSMMQRINSGEASQADIENYSLSESPTASNGNENSSYSNAGEPETSAPADETPTAPENSGDE